LENVGIEAREFLMNEERWSLKIADDNIMDEIIHVQNHLAPKSSDERA